jgi:hypothetical protein
VGDFSVAILGCALLLCMNTMLDAAFPSQSAAMILRVQQQHKVKFNHLCTGDAVQCDQMMAV